MDERARLNNWSGERRGFGLWDDDVRCGPSVGDDGRSRGDDKGLVFPPWLLDESELPDAFWGLPKVLNAKLMRPGLTPVPAFDCCTSGLLPIFLWNFLEPPCAMSSGGV